MMPPGTVGGGDVPSGTWHITFEQPVRVIQMSRSVKVYAATGRFTDGETPMNIVFRTKEIYVAKGEDTTAVTMAIDLHLQWSNIVGMIAIREN